MKQNCLPPLHSPIFIGEMPCCKVETGKSALFLPFPKTHTEWKYLLAADLSQCRSCKKSMTGIGGLLSFGAAIKNCHENGSTQIDIRQNCAHHHLGHHGSGHLLHPVRWAERGGHDGHLCFGGLDGVRGIGAFGGQGQLPADAHCPAIFR